MRIISGTLRGKKLSTLEGIETRPTLDRVKESIFNIIQSDIKDANVLDLFGGSGALGLEALSRGANKAVFCDSSKAAIRIIEKNIKDTKLECKSQIINNDYLKALDMLNEKFDIIFLDPPYKTNFAINAINKIIKLNLLSENGIIIFETNDEDKEKEILKNDNIEIYDKRRYGIAFVMFIRKG